MDQSRVEVVLRRYWCWQFMGGERQPFLSWLVLMLICHYIHGGIPDARGIGSLYGWKGPLAIV